jgi:hypothetical protein
MNTCFSKSRLLGFILAAASSGGVLAQTAPINVTTTATPFLRINPDARSGGMGDVGLATMPDAGSSLVNLAKTPYAKTSSAIGLSYTPWMKDVASDVYLAVLSGYHQLNDKQAIGASFRYFNVGDIQVEDYSGNKLQTARPREYSVDLGYGRKLSSAISLGLAFRYINSSLASGYANGTTYKAATAFAADVSMYYHGLDEKGAGWTAGLAVTNLGSRIGYTNNTNDRNYLPANLGAGVGYTFVADEVNEVTLSADVNKLLVPAIPMDSAGLVDYHTGSLVSSWSKSFNSGNYQVGVGAEYRYDKLLALRAGYHYGDKHEGNQSYFTAGFGLLYSSFTLNFSYLAPSGNGTTRNPLSNTLRFGVIFSLEKMEK